MNTVLRLGRIGTPWVGCDESEVVDDEIHIARRDFEVADARL